MISLYVPGTSLIHRLPPGVKILVLALTALGLSLAPAGWTVIGVSLALPPVLYAAASLGWRVFGRDVRQLLLILAFLVITQVLFMPLLAAASNTARVIAVVLMAQVLTRTTPVEEMVLAAQRWMEPLRRFGVDPDRVGLAMGLTMTSIGQVGALITQVRDAQRSRGVRLAPWSWVVPVMVLTLQHADQIGDALEARGVLEDS